MAFNPAAEELSGYRRDDVLGQEMTGLLIPERERAAFVAHTERYLATGDRGEYIRRVRVPLLCADGTERNVELTARQLTRDDGTFFCGFFRDLTEFEHTQAALAESQARFSLLAQLAPVGIVQTGADGRAVFVNDRWCAIAGVRANDALGRDWLDLVHPPTGTGWRVTWPRRPAGARCGTGLPAALIRRRRHLGQGQRRGAPGRRRRPCSGSWPRSPTSPMSSRPKPTGNGCSRRKGPPAAASPTRPSASTA